MRNTASPAFTGILTRPGRWNCAAVKKETAQTLVPGWGAGKNYTITVIIFKALIMEDKKYIQSVICNAWQVLFLKNLDNADKLEKALDNLSVRYRIKRQRVIQPDGTEVMEPAIVIISHDKLQSILDER